MVVHCCECGNLVSDKAEACQFCGFDMRLPVSGEQKKRLALGKLRRSQAWVAGAIVLTLLTTLLSVELIRSAHALKEIQQAASLKPDEPRAEDMAISESNYQTTVTLAVLFGIGDIVLLTWAIRRCRWHQYLYRKEFGRSRRKSAYPATHPGASRSVGES